MMIIARIELAISKSSQIIQDHIVPGEVADFSVVHTDHAIRTAGYHTSRLCRSSIGSVHIASTSKGSGGRENR